MCALGKIGRNMVHCLNWQIAFVNEALLSKHGYQIM